MKEFKVSQKSNKFNCDEGSNPDSQLFGFNNSYLQIFVRENFIDSPVFCYYIALEKIKERMVSLFFFSFSFPSLPFSWRS